ncbi:MAG: hypothetical protein DIZ80_11190 [endosymbiont of Galathealinum brachiosum]|uniref:Uncharacterized protein n=1 Tax=endosymbiont of Galathealinum brachiosum TaxID=2200906 RepID=A0A370DD47_9GAMM|nr:MAG: hypothetical protein DIZ80_11190 [endosymbiont of Galathealinum brachiosum]
MEIFISLDIIWQDQDLVEILIKSSNGKFYGETEVYTNYSELSDLALSLMGFPKSVSENIYYSAGEKNSYSFASIYFYCFSVTGHTAALVNIEANIASNQRKEEKHEIKMEVQFEALAIDKFQNQVVNMVKNKYGKATLNGVSPFTQNIA